jgi:hypothetical protein
MADYLGDFTTVNTVYVYFNTFDSNDPSASTTPSGLTVGDIFIYKNGSTTERSSTAGFTLLDTDGIDFDGKTGINGFSIDLADNTDAGFYAAGNEYTVVVASITVDAATVNFVAANFSIERTGGALALLKGTNSLADIEGKIDTLTTNLATVDTVVDSILVDTAEIGVAGAGLTAINLPDQTMNITGNLSGSVGSVTAAVTLPTIPADWITSSGVAASVVIEIQSGLATSVSIAALNNLSSADVTAAVPTATDNADTLLNRDMAAVSDTNARTLLNAIRFLRNLWNTTETPGSLTVKKEDDTTTAWTAALTSDPTAEPITGINPS